MIQGEWLLNPQLMNKRLDVRIYGTTNPLWRNGRYENTIGFVVLRMPVKSVNDSILVMMGYTQRQVYFHAHHLSPEITTEQKGPSLQFMVPANPIVSVPGTTVVIIGANLMGNSDYIGEYAIIIRSPIMYVMIVD